MPGPQAGLAHEATNLEAPNGKPGEPQLVPQRTASRSPSRLIEELRNLGPEPNALSFRAASPRLVREVAGPAHSKHLTELLDHEMRSQPVDQSERSISSAIKSAVAFFRMVFSRSSLLTGALRA